jgi:hypothetical protein
MDDFHPLLGVMGSLVFLLVEVIAVAVPYSIQRLEGGTWMSRRRSC